jgi:23S rRNA G2445 N2-methylase RlmL
VIGGDLLSDRVRASRRNLDAAGQPDAVCEWDACAMPVASASVDKVAVNLPFGKQVGSREEIETLYPRFFAELERVLKPGARTAALSSEYELVKKTVRERPGLHVVTGYSVSVLGQWARIYVIARTDVESAGDGRR